MIESCTKKRMLLGIILIGGLTVVVLIIESHWLHTPIKRYSDNWENNVTCSSEDDYEIVSECQPCTDFEIVSQNINVCAHARYKQVLRCKSGKTVTKSCDKVIWLEERTFWKFEISMLALSIISYLSVHWRENVLRQRIMRKVAKQLRGGV